MSAHTKGPWHTDGQIVEVGNGWRIATMHGDLPRNMEANAHIIAAAPEMLEALEEIQRAMENMVDDADVVALFGEIKASRAAIAKAKGEKA